MLAQDELSLPRGLESEENTVSIHADSQTKEKQLYQLHGHVEVTYRQWKMTSDEGSYDQSTGEVTARGNVIFTAPESNLTAEEAHFNTLTGVGWFINGSGYVHSPAPPRRRVLKTENPFYIKARRVDRLDESTYRVKRAREHLHERTNRMEHFRPQRACGSGRQSGQ